MLHKSLPDIVLRFCNKIQTQSNDETQTKSISNPRKYSPIKNDL